MFKYSHISVGLDDIAVIPESVTTISDDDVDLTTTIGDLKLRVPIIGAALDSVMSTELLSELNRFGGIGLINLCGLIARYPLGDYSAIDARLRQSPTLTTLQAIYGEAPISVEILAANLGKVQALVGEEFAVAATPQQAERLFDVALQQGIRTFAIQASFISPYWSSSRIAGLNIGKYVQYLHQNNCTVMVGNVASLNASVPLIEAGVDAILSGIGSGTICSTRTVLGIGAGHVATIDSIREYIEKQKSKTRIIADGGIHNSGDIVKLICCGAHAVMLGTLLARTMQAPFLGYSWGMAAFSKILPRGTLLSFEVNEADTVERLFTGPSDRDDGTLSLIPAITNAFANLGCKDIASAYRDTLVTRFPGVHSEGKIR